MLSFKQKIAKNYINARGWRTNRKLLIIESDDWGSIHMPDKKTYDYFLQNNLRVDKQYFDKNDSLESVEDLEYLFDVLSSFKDIYGNPTVITAFAVVANPDFEKIEKCNRQEYHYELITESYKRHPHTFNAFALFLEGVEKRLLYPQFHGREHINVKRWMEAINSPSIMYPKTFEKKALIDADYESDIYHYPHNIFSAFDKTDVTEIEFHKEIISDGLNRFKKLFGFSSSSFMAPTGIWDDSINETLYNNGVKLFHGRQAIVVDKNKFRFVHKKWGVKNNLGQLAWRRNCTFEPSRDQTYDWVNHCLQEMEIAFRWGKPAVINSHRVNFIGSIFPENRKQSLEKLASLISKTQKKWPDIEFVSTQELAEIMIQDLNFK